MHFLKNYILSGRLNTACIYHGKLAAKPFGVGIDAVAGNAGGILDDGQPLADQLIEQGG